MVTKKLLLEILHNSLDVEEKAVPFYMEHLSSAVTWAGLDKEKEDEIRRTFKRLGRDSAEHKRIVSELIKKIEGDPRDAF